MDARQGGVQAAGKPSDEHADEDNVGELLGWSGGAEAAAEAAGKKASAAAAFLADPKAAYQKALEEGRAMVRAGPASPVKAKKPPSKRRATVRRGDGLLGASALP